MRRLKCAKYAHILDRRMSLNDIIIGEEKKRLNERKGKWLEECGENSEMYKKHVDVNL